MSTIFRRVLSQLSLSLNIVENSQYNRRTKHQNTNDGKHSKSAVKLIAMESNVPCIGVLLFEILLWDVILAIAEMPMK